MATAPALLFRARTTAPPTVNTIRTGDASRFDLATHHPHECGTIAPVSQGTLVTPPAADPPVRAPRL